MSLLNIFTIVIFLLSLILITIGQTIPLNNTNLNKISPYECGFDPINSPRLPFSFRFFLIAILFLLFDLEIALLIPLPISFNLSNTNNSLWIFSIFIIILTYGLYYEWAKGGLDWAND
uniref:NADH-ubiquinone oxidoreductase chain 3 n=1 Tax=Gorgonocephalus chilensis TaxID=1258644 RepID=A0A3G2WI49_9ECHI|nr:NADH dehydrogenase subunit 3 [Gorgonocephalus chilensis]AYO99621.1 NADH dehydrogenase subunit 3 [Gorgonocephalus chilensis]